MCAETFACSVLVLIVFFVMETAKKTGEKERLAKMSPAEREAYLLANEHGEINPAMVCPHCQEKGHIRTKLVDRAKGVSGGKATAAVLTGGVSMLATGLSRHERLTRAYCCNCKNSWEF